MTNNLDPKPRDVRDVENDAQLRPGSIREFIGQAQTDENLRIFIQAALFAA